MCLLYDRHFILRVAELKKKNIYHNYLSLILAYTGL